ncbi:MAG: hypothetical protein V1865_02810 [bacterium]
MRIGKCLKCRHIRRLQKHHIYPRRHFGNGKQNKKTLELCNECHLEIDRTILLAEAERETNGLLVKQELYFYEKHHEDFLGKDVFWEAVRLMLIKNGRQHRNDEIILLKDWRKLIPEKIII